MATSKNDVTLTLRTNVEGQEEVDALGKSYVELAGVGKQSEAAFAAQAATVDRMRAELLELQAATKAQRAAEAETTAAVREAGQALNDQKDARARLRAEAKAGNVDADKFRADELAMTRAIIEGNAALRQKREAQTAAAAASRAAAAAEQALAADIKTASATIAASAQKQIANNQALKASVADVGTQLRQVQALAGAVIGGRGAWSAANACTQVSHTRRSNISISRNITSVHDPGTPSRTTTAWSLGAGGVPPARRSVVRSSAVRHVSVSPN